MPLSRVEPKVPRIQEFLRWMPDGDLGNRNFPTYPDYINNAIRKDGILPNSIADCKSLNKALYQLTLMMVGFAEFLNDNGIDLFDSMESAEIAQSIQKAIDASIIERLASGENAQLQKSVAYSQYEYILPKNIGADYPVQVIEHDIDGMNMLVYVDGLLYKKGTRKDPDGTKCWYEYGEAGTASRFIKFRCPLSEDASIVSIRLGSIVYTIKDPKEDEEDVEE